MVEIIGNVLALTNHREPYKVGADTESSTLSGSHADGRREDVQHSEHCSGGDGHGHNLVHGKGLTGNKEEGKCSSSGYTA